MLIIEFDIQGLWNEPPLGTDTTSSAVAKQAGPTTGGFGFNTNRFSTLCFLSLSVNTPHNNLETFNVGGSECSNIGCLKDLQDAKEDQPCNQSDGKMTFDFMY